MICKKCTPVPHDHLDHSYQSYMVEDDSSNEIVLHIYSCKVCPCHTEKEGGDMEEFKQYLISLEVLEDLDKSVEAKPQTKTKAKSKKD